MRKIYFPKQAPVWAFAAILAVAAPGAPFAQAASHRSNTELLSSQLPEGETLRSAPMKDLKSAVRSAVSKRPADAADIVRIAILAKTPKERAVSCDMVREIVDAALKSASSQAREISEMALSLAPDCAEAIERAVGGPATGSGTAGAVPGTTASDSTVNNSGTATGDGSSPGDGFSAGFGPGFPGSPTFSGSSPSGGFALPPLPPTTPVPVTTVVND